MSEPTESYLEHVIPDGVTPLSDTFSDSFVESLIEVGYEGGDGVMFMSDTEWEKIRAMFDLEPRIIEDETLQWNILVDPGLLPKETEQQSDTRPTYPEHPRRPDWQNRTSTNNSCEFDLGGEDE